MAAALRIFVSFLAFIGTPVQANPACPEIQEGMTNVHLVCHTHDDVGWLNTFEQYYNGPSEVWEAPRHSTDVGVRFILDSVVESLQKDPGRKFVYAESAFFFRWWEEQDLFTRNLVADFVSSGQLEFVGGGWSMNDEATAHYSAIIDQMTLGFAKLNETFGSIAVPRVAWQVDPFGHSKEQASLFAQMGMDGLFFSRLDHKDKELRWNTKTMEMVWKGSNSLGTEAWIFTGVLPTTYAPPRGFCFDVLCSDEQISHTNKDLKVDEFLKAVRDQQEGYRTPNIMMTMGQDFHYMDAELWYQNLDKLIRYVNERQMTGSKVNVFYSTPSCYLDALHDANLTWSSKTDDFFPYSSSFHGYWTGYFTSRPSLKGFIRFSNNVLQAAKQICALAGLGRGRWITGLSEAMGVAQHHDAVTGTAKQHVTDDYANLLAQGLDDATDTFQPGLSYFTGKKNLNTDAIGDDVKQTYFCPLLNTSSCPYTELNKEFVVNVYNPMARPRSLYVRVPVLLNSQVTGFTVTDELGGELEVQLVPVPFGTQDIPGRDSIATHDLVFLAKDLPSLGLEQFLVQPRSGPRNDPPRGLTLLRQGEEYSFENGKIRITLEAFSHKLKTISSLGQDTTVKNVTQEWLWYAGTNSGFSSSYNSGAYLFRPMGDPHLVANTASTFIFEGPLGTEVQQQWSEWLTQVIRLYRDTPYVEVQWVVGPIPIEDSIGKEVVTRFSWTEMSTNGIFYTDANGREMQRRVKDYRETWNLTSTEPVSQNYYPVTSRMILSSVNGMGSAVVLNDRAQGGTSLSEGEMELMVHRRLLVDDCKGVDEALNETAFGEGLVATGRHLLLHSDAATRECDFGCQHRLLGEEVLMQPILTFSSPSSFAPRLAGLPKATGLSQDLPPNLRVLTLEPFSEVNANEWLLRIENFFEAGESSLSGDTSVDLQDIFADWIIEDVEELTLGANQLKDRTSRLQWRTDSDQEVYYRKRRALPQRGYSFTPMQIRTFRIQVSPKVRKLKNTE